jgi:hypothetical protein
LIRIARRRSGTALSRHRQSRKENARPAIGTVRIAAFDGGVGDETLLTENAIRPTIRAHAKARARHRHDYHHHHAEVGCIVVRAHSKGSPE